ncbi:MCE family protein [uncultured Jatrophihabitans sp.]|uniref:MCE family protein n=1 Tax=uncultured Jatrophihabitans sp. TaxID=1610747 RepID=UPI0035CB879A
MIATLRKNMSRVITIAVVLAVVAGGIWYFVLRDAGQKTATADFSAAVGIYKGTPVKILGVQVGDVTAVTPKAGYVEVKMEYSSSYKVPANGGAVTVANSLVSDRYVQLAPVYKSGPVMKSGAVIPVKRTAAPAELDEIYSALNKLSVALGPAGVNKGGTKQQGALSALVDVSAANLKGNGAALGNSIHQMSEAARTLSDNRGNLFATVRNLQQFTTTLKNNDKYVRDFNNQLAQAASDLAGERGDLGTALHDLGLALDAVNGFVKDNAAKFHTDFKGLASITNTVVKQKASVNEALSVAPIALANITHAYYPTANYGALATRSNIASLSNLSLSTLVGQVCTTLSKVTGGLPVLGGNVSKTCSTVAGLAPNSTSLPSTTMPTVPGSGSAPTVPSVPSGTTGGSGLPMIPGAVSGSGS